MSNTAYLKKWSSGKVGVSDGRGAVLQDRRADRGGAVQLMDNRASAVAQRNNTGLPNQLKNGVENLSGMSMDHVRVHYNSSKPAQMQAHAYAQGSDIHVASGQERHLPHEAWHVVQQAQGRVKPTAQLKAGMAINDDLGLEREADVMGGRALSSGGAPAQLAAHHHRGAAEEPEEDIIQAKSVVRNYGQTFNWGTHKTIVGHKMEAWLDPGDPVKGESANINTDQTPMMDALRVHYSINGGDLVKGHLLNDNLGGKAMNNNLFPITRAANKLHLQTTENYAKTALWTHKHPIWYSVVVSGTPGASQHSHTFDVKLGPWNMLADTHTTAVQGSITSDMGNPRDYDGANGDDMDTYSAGTLSAAMAKKVALHPHTAVSGMSDHEKAYRDATGKITNTEHGSGGYTKHS